MAKKKQSNPNDIFTKLDKILIGPESALETQNDSENYNVNNDKTILWMLLYREISEIKLRGRLTLGLVVIMVVQIIAINVVVISMGIEKLAFSIPQEPLRWLFTFVIAEVVGFVTMIVKYLFKNDTTQTLDLISKYIDRMQQPSYNQYDEEEDIDFGDEVI